MVFSAFGAPQSSKLRPAHLERRALIYIRQSTLMQVRHHRGSTVRQYDLVARARELGWAPEHIEVIDQDQGQSGASTVGRDGFQQLVAQVGLGQAGAVFCLEASRLARSCSDWYRLLELCALSDTLVIDEEGLYDPGQYNDRLLLGFKGTMSEAELHWLRQRLDGGRWAKAKQGQLRFRLPVGLLYDACGQIILDPDEEVQAAVRLALELYAQHSSAMAVVAHFAQHQLRFPTRRWEVAHQGELVWRRLCRGRVLFLLHNPLYAGAYVYARRCTRTHLRPGEAPRLRGYTRQLKREEWPIVLQQSHPGYISWEQFLHNQQQLEDNRNWHPATDGSGADLTACRGAARAGAALLQGVALCGRCGRRMSVRYRADGVTPSYECNRAHSQLGERTCQTIRGDGIDAAVANSFLAALAPAHLDVSLAALEHLEERARQTQRQWQLRLERSQYEADLARRRFVAVEPENRLVARTLERDWNEKLAAAERLERDYANLAPRTVPNLGPQERQRVLALAQDLPAVWHAATTTHVERKQLLRFLVKDVTLTKREHTVEVALRWQTEALTWLAVPRPRLPYEVYQTPPAVVALIRELASTHTDRQIAAHLNQAGLCSGKGQPFNKKQVLSIRYRQGIVAGCMERPSAHTGDFQGQRGDGRYAAATAAVLLNVDVSTIAIWCRQGRLESVRGVAGGGGPYWITLTPEIIAALRRPVRRQWSPTRRRNYQHQAQSLPRAKG